MDTNHIMAVMTTDSKEEADSIAEFLVEERFAACVQVLGPIESTYHWEGRIEKTKEFISFIKTDMTRYPLVEKAIKDNHSYEVPEIIALPIAMGNPDYLRWLSTEIATRSTFEPKKDR